MQGGNARREVRASSGSRRVEDDQVHRPSPPVEQRAVDGPGKNPDLR
jgi:hypothetical protein